MELFAPYAVHSKIRELYIMDRHKRVHALTFQSIVTPNGIIANLYGPVGKLSLLNRSVGEKHNCYFIYIY